MDSAGTSQATKSAIPHRNGQVEQILDAHHIQTKEGEDGAPMPLLEGWVAQLLHNRKHLQTRPAVVLMLSVSRTCCQLLELISSVGEGVVQAVLSSDHQPTVAAVQGAQAGHVSTGHSQLQVTEGASWHAAALHNSHSSCLGQGRTSTTSCS